MTKEQQQQEEDKHMKELTEAKYAAELEQSPSLTTIPPSYSSPTEQKVNELLNEFTNLLWLYQRVDKDYRGPDWDPEEERRKIETRFAAIQYMLTKAIENGGFEK